MNWRERKQPAPSVDKIENLVGRSCKVRGDLAADGAFRVDGAVTGTIESKAAVVVGESGEVQGDVRATDVVVAGKIHGNVFCSGHLEILSSGTIEGDIEAKSLRIESGGVFAGTSRMGVTKAAAPPEPDASALSPRLNAVR